MKLPSIDPQEECWGKSHNLWVSCGHRYSGRLSNLIGFRKCWLSYNSIARKQPSLSLHWQNLCMYLTWNILFLFRTLSFIGWGLKVHLTGPSIHHSGLTYFQSESFVAACTVTFNRRVTLELCTIFIKDTLKDKPAFSFRINKSWGHKQHLVKCLVLQSIY